MNILLASFVEILKNEWLGLVASAFVLLSFIMTNQVWIRIINMVGCIAFVVYGMILPSYATAFMNGAVFIVHIVYLTKYFLKKRREQNAESQEPLQEQNDKPQEEQE